MANPNPEVYGTSETWSKCTIFYTVGDGDPETKTIAPRINVWDSTSIDRRKGTLSRAITAGKLTAGIPIDPTICPCGQDPSVSCFGKIAMFTNHSDNDANKIPDKIVTYTDSVNWFFSEIWAYLPEGRAFKSQLTDRESNLCRWSPNGDLTTPTNQNRYVTPFVYYQLKSIFANIYVETITGYDNYGRPITATVSLEGWKNNYPTRKIISAVLNLKGVTSQTGGTMAYTSGNLDSELSVGVSLLNDIDGIVDYYTYYVDRQQYFRLFGGLSANAFNTTDTYYMLGYDMFENAEVKSSFISGVTDGGWNVWQEVPYSEANYEKILKMAACFGIPFSPTLKESFAAEFTDNDLYLPVIDENGIAHGEYTHGLRNVANPLYDLDGVRDINYNPAQKTDPNTYSNQTYFNPIINLASATKRYVLTAANVEQLMKDLWTVSDSLVHTNPNEPYKDYTSIALDNFLVNSPIQCIVSLDKYPINNIPTGTQAEHIPLGKTTVPNGAIGKPLTRTTMEFNFSSVDIFPRFGGCFLDYEPYTHYELYVPFCGTTEINASDILGHKLSVIEIVDFTTGTITAYIMADNLAINTVSGNCAITIPLSGTDTTMVNSEINNALITAKSTQLQSKTTGKVGGLIGNLPRTIVRTLSAPLDVYTSAVQDKWNTELADYNLHHIETPMHLISSASPVGMWSLEMTCRLMCYYPTGDVINDSKPPSLIADKIAEFGNMQGFATVDTGKVNEYHGFTMGTLRTESISCTESERQRLKTLFATGVILP